MAFDENDYTPDVGTMVDRVRSSMLHTDYRFNFLEAIAANALDDAQTFVSNVEEFIKTLSVDEFPQLETSEMDEIPDLDYSNRPELGRLDFTFNAPSFSKDLQLKSFEAVDSLINGLSFDLPNLGSADVSLPSAPNLAALGNIPASPSVSMPAVPAAPTNLAIPDPPTIRDFDVIDFPTVSIPSFDVDFVPSVIANPGEFSWGDTPVYTSDIYADILINLLDGLRNGGTGLAPDVEQAIYDNHLRRINEASESRIEEAENYFAGRGFTLPSGMLAYKLSRISREALASKEQASREVMTSQAELAQKNTHFIMERGLQLEGVLREFFVSNANMSLSAQKAAAGYAIEAHRAMAEGARLNIEQWKAQYEVWKAKVENAKLPFEEAKLKLEIAKGNADIQRLHVDIYKSRLDGARMGLDLYKGQLDAVRVAAEIEGIRVQIFESEIKAWLARVEANSQLVNLYKGQLEGEKVKVDIFNAEVTGYVQTLEARKKKLDALIARRDSIVEENKARVLEFNAYVDKYKADLDAETKIIGAKVDGFRADAAAYSAETDREKAHYEAKLSQIDSRVKVAGYKLQESMARLEAAVRGFESIKKLQLEGLTGVMNVGAQLAASAIQGINTNTSISYSGGDSFQQSTSWQHSKVVTASA